MRPGGTCGFGDGGNGGPGVRNCTLLNKHKSHVVAGLSVRNAVHSLMRETLRSVSTLYLPRHCFEQKLL